LTIVNIVYFYIHLCIFFSWSRLGYWLIDESKVDENINVFISTDRSSFPNNKISIFTGRPPISSIFNSMIMLFLSKLNLLQYNRKCSEHSFLYPHEQALCTSTCMYILFLVALEVLIDWRVKCRWNIHVLFSSNCTYLCKIPMNSLVTSIYI
jgi:hypothetical protein